MFPSVTKLQSKLGASAHAVPELHFKLLFTFYIIHNGSGQALLCADFFFKVF